MTFHLKINFMVILIIATIAVFYRTERNVLEVLAMLAIVILGALEIFQIAGDESNPTHLKKKIEYLVWVVRDLVAIFLVVWMIYKGSVASGHIGGRVMCFLALIAWSMVALKDFNLFRKTTRNAKNSGCIS